LRKILPNARAHEMLVFLEGKDAIEAEETAHRDKRKRKSMCQIQCPEAVSFSKACQPGQPEGAHDQCTICQEHLNAYNGAKQTSLPCKHSFHRDCIIPWLQEKPNCPVCRTNVRLEFPSDGSGDVRVVAATPASSTILNIECAPCGASTNRCVVSPVHARSGYGATCGVSPTLCGSSSGSACSDTMIPPCGRSLLTGQQQVQPQQQRIGLLPANKMISKESIIVQGTAPGSRFNVECMPVHPPIVRNPTMPNNFKPNNFNTIDDLELPQAVPEARPAVAPKMETLFTGEDDWLDSQMDKSVFGSLGVAEDFNPGDDSCLAFLEVD